MSTTRDSLRGPPQPLPQGCQRLDPGPHRPHRHLLQRHEVCALPDPLEDLGQMGVDEGVIWKAAEHSERKADPSEGGCTGHLDQPCPARSPGGEAEVPLCPSHAEPKVQRRRGTGPTPHSRPSLGFSLLPRSISPLAHRPLILRTKAPEGMQGR